MIGSKETESLNWEKTTVILLKSVLLRGLCLGLLLFGLLGQGSTLAQSDKAPLPAKTLKVLFLGDRGHHVPRERFDELNPLLADRKIDLTYTESLGDLRLGNLKNYDALVVYANIDVIDAEAERGLLDYVRGGGGFVPLHCASFCFRNSKEVVAMIGGQFQRHGTGVFRTQIAKSDHPVMRGFGGFESWDETYVHHLHNEDGRVVLDYRVDAEGREPWTWVRQEGKGRVFYTAWGHDGRTWTNPGFANLVERGIRWAAGDDPAVAGEYLKDRGFPIPKMTELTKELAAFEYLDVGKKIPNYTPSNQWGAQGEPLNMMQRPLDPAESQKHIVTPEGFRIELFVAEPDLQGKPIFMTWDERGRLWVCETVDYPNELQPPGSGRDRIRICEDTDGDGRADKFTVFAESLSIPASLAFHKGGVIVQNGIQTLYLRDTNGDDQADERELWFEGWNQGDTHGGVSNFQYGLDNWIWAMQGYNHSEPSSNKKYPGFHQGFFRIHPNTREIEFLRATNNNTWGLGITEDGLIFGSTANGNPSVFMPIPNRYYEQVAGWRKSLTLSSIADSNKFQPITERVRQVDWHGGYTAAAGHAIYTGRNYPQEYWNQTAFVCEPTGHLVGTFILKRDGAGFRSSNPFNLVASNDEWTAPIMAEVGPDGNVWVIDWYNYIVQHNPTPQGFQTGKGAAYESDLRDKKHGRIYRVVYNDKPATAPPKFNREDVNSLIAGLSHPTQLWRKHAQRLLVERGEKDIVPALLRLIANQDVDPIGLNVGAIHALWTLQGLGAIKPENPAVLEAVSACLSHPSAGVRRNALQVIPGSDVTVEKITRNKLLSDDDPQVRLQAFLSLADTPSSELAAIAAVEGLRESVNFRDQHLRDAATSALARHARYGLPELARLQDLPAELREPLAIVAEHAARRSTAEQLDLNALISGLNQAQPEVAAIVVRGLVAGWPDRSAVPLTPELEEGLAKLVERLPLAERSPVLQLADHWGSRKLEGYAQEITAGLLKEFDDENKSVEERLAAAERLVDFRPGSVETASALLERITPQMEPGLATGIVKSMAKMQADEVGPQLAANILNWPPSVQRTAVEILLGRRGWTGAAMELLEQGQLQITDLSLEQRTNLQNHPNEEIRKRAMELLARGGALPNADRQAVLTEYEVATHSSGNATAGKQVFLNVCAKCHKHSGEGQQIGPELTGMAVHPKEELLVHILDPSRSVETNYRMFQVQTIDGLTLAGMLGGESKTAIELIDSQGQRKSVLREEIEEMKGSRLSVMPEGIEKEITVAQMTDLLEFLTQRGTWLPLDVAKVATVASDRGMFYSREAEAERLVFPEWKVQEFNKVPFQLVDPQDGQRANVILLRGPRGSLTERLPQQVELPVNAPGRAIHFLSGVSGWGFPYGGDKSVSMIVKLHYEDGTTEEHPLRNGEHFADYIRRVDVPKSEHAFDLAGRQIRYLAVFPEKALKITKLELIKGPDQTAPVVMAITVETR